MTHLEPIADDSRSERDEAFRADAPAAVAWAWAALFALMGILDFVPESLAAAYVPILTNTSHSFVHVKAAAAFAGVALADNVVSIWFTKAFGGFYLIFVVVGFILSSGTPTGCLLGLTDLGGLDNLLHLGCGASILASGYISAMRI